MPGEMGTVRVLFYFIFRVRRVELKLIFFYQTFVILRDEWLFSRRFWGRRKSMA